ncbi:hypothetical protein BJ944DRAFT_272125 [Cunninghamella echinulata]|nr:hypothetical protein BJ944DRAFT_272125 [Cunninghamella echinulata]
MSDSNKTTDIIVNQPDFIKSNEKIQPQKHDDNDSNNKIIETRQDKKAKENAIMLKTEHEETYSTSTAVAMDSNSCEAMEKATSTSDIIKIEQPQIDQVENNENDNIQENELENESDSSMENNNNENESDMKNSNDECDTNSNITTCNDDGNIATTTTADATNKRGKRTPYKTATKQQLDILVDEHVNSKLSISAAARKAGIARSTAATLMKKYKSNQGIIPARRPRGRTAPPTLSSIHTQWIDDFLRQHQDATLSKIKKHLLMAHPSIPHISISALQRHISIKCEMNLKRARK